MCRLKKKIFHFAITFGLIGYFFEDFGMTFECSEEKNLENESIFINSVNIVHEKMILQSEFIRGLKNMNVNSIKIINLEGLELLDNNICKFNFVNDEEIEIILQEDILNAL